MIIRSNEVRVRKIAGLFIMPTLNTFSAEQGKALEAHPDFQIAVKLGKLEILEVDSIDEKQLDKAQTQSEELDGSEIVALVKNASVDDAKDLIAEILNISQLKSIIETDRRRAVKKAAQEQLSTLTNEEDE